MLALVILAQAAQTTTNDALSEATKYLIGLGTAGIVIILSFWGKIYWWPAIKDLKQDKADQAVIIARYASMYEDQVLPALSNATEVQRTSSKAIDANTTAVLRAEAAFIRVETKLGQLEAQLGLVEAELARNRRDP